MALSYGVSDYVEGGVITAVIVANVLIGFYQEYKAEKDGFLAFISLSIRTRDSK